MNRFQDKVAIVTGGASGIGLAVAKRLASEGARVVIVDISEENLAKATPDIEAAGAPAVWGSACNVGVEADVEATVAETLNRFGRLDVVVNSAGMMVFIPLEELTGDDWQKVLSVNLLGAFFFTKQAFLHMKPGGSIVNVSSVHAVATEPLVAPYAASKAALQSLTRSASIEGKPKGLRVNTVIPGAIDTEMLWTNPHVAEGRESIDPSDVGKREEVGTLVAYLASDDAAFVQGAEMRVDGGRMAGL